MSDEKGQAPVSTVRSPWEVKFYRERDAHDEVLGKLGRMREERDEARDRIEDLDAELASYQAALDEARAEARRYREALERLGREACAFDGSYANCWEAIEADDIDAGEGIPCARCISLQALEPRATTSKPAGELDPGTVEAELELLKAAMRLNVGDAVGSEGTVIRRDVSNGYFGFWLDTGGFVSLPNAVICLRRASVSALGQGQGKAQKSELLPLQTPTASPLTCGTCRGYKQVVGAPCGPGCSHDHPEPCPDCASPPPAPVTCPRETRPGCKEWCSDACYAAGRHVHPTNPQANPQRAR